MKKNEYYVIANKKTGVIDVNCGIFDHYPSADISRISCHDKVVKVRVIEADAVCEWKPMANPDYNSPACNKDVRIQRYGKFCPYCGLPIKEAKEKRG